MGRSTDTREDTGSHGEKKTGDVYQFFSAAEKEVVNVTGFSSLQKRHLGPTESSPGVVVLLPRRCDRRGTTHTSLAEHPPTFVPRMTSSSIRQTSDTRSG